MKQSLLIFSILALYSMVNFAMEEKPHQRKRKEPTQAQSHVDPKLQRLIIETEIKLALNSVKDDPLKAVLEAFKYLNTATSINKFPELKPSLKEKLTYWAKEKFALKFKGINQAELDKKFRKILIEIDADLNVPNTLGEAPLISIATARDSIGTNRIAHPLAFQNLIESIRKKNLEEVKKLLQQIKEKGLNLNLITFKNQPLFYYLMDKFLDNTKFSHLIIVQYFIQGGIDLNNIYSTQNFISNYDQLTPLEYIIYHTSKPIPFDINDETLYERAIDMFLAHGANITPKAIELLKKSKLNKEIFQIFEQHESMMKEAQENPTHELLLDAISKNKPYIVKVIVQTKRELVSRESIELANLTSHFSVAILEQSIKKFRESKFVQASLTPELIKYIEQFVLK